MNEKDYTTLRYILLKALHRGKFKCGSIPVTQEDVDNAERAYLDLIKEDTLKGSHEQKRH